MLIDATRFPSYPDSEACPGNRCVCCDLAFAVDGAGPEAVSLEFLTCAAMSEEMAVSDSSTTAFRNVAYRFDKDIPGFDVLFSSMDCA
jgi:hypothetical protein